MAANAFFDWAVSLVRFIPRDTARAEDVNDALDEVSNGFTDVEALTNAAIKLSAGETSAALGNAASRLGKVLSFNAATGAAETAYTVDQVATVSGIAADVTTVAGISGNVTAVAGIQANVTTVAGISADVTSVATNSASVSSVASNIASVNSAATNMAAIIAAPTEASNAATSASNALASEAAAAASYDSFDDRYLGAKAADPATDNDGGVLVDGALYFNSVAGEMRAWSGAAWVATYLPAGAYALDADLATHTGSTEAHGATGAVVGTTNAQTLSNKTLTAPAINGIVTTTGLTMPAFTSGAINGSTIPTGKTLADTDTAQTLTNKTIVAANNTITTAASGNLAATNLNAALAELQGDIDTRAVLAGSASQSFDMLNGTVAGNIAFTGTGNRITGDFSASTLANRTMFQTNVVNGGTDIHAIPNGTGTRAGFLAYNNSDIAAATSNTQLLQLSTETRLTAGGSSPLPITFFAGGIERMRIDTAGAVTIPGTLSLTGASSTLGYGTGAGGTVTQATSKSTAVTLNKPSGQITMNNAALAAGASVTFSVSSTLVASADTVLLSSPTFGLSYRLECASVASGLFYVRVTNITGGSLSEAVVINFAIIKGATS